MFRPDFAGSYRLLLPSNTLQREIIDPLFEDALWALIIWFNLYSFNLTPQENILNSTCVQWNLGVGRFWSINNILCSRLVHILQSLHRGRRENNYGS